MANLITTDELKAYPLPVTAQQWAKIGDDQLEIVIGYASDAIERWLDRRLINGNYVESYVGSGSHKMLLKQYPVTYLYSVSSYNDSWSPTPWDTTSFIVHEGPGILEFMNKGRYEFSTGTRWLVDYDAGYTTLPGVVKHAVALQTVEMLQPLFRGGSSFVEVELISDLDEQIVDMLDTLKRRRL